MTVLDAAEERGAVHQTSVGLTRTFFTQYGRTPSLEVMVAGNFLGKAKI